jgi:3-oxoacyl-[acyl-carrier-protein] synthase II
MTAARMAVTGLGVVSGFGSGREALRAGLESGATAIRPVARFDVSTFRTRLAAEVPGRAASGAGDRLSLADRFALEAAAEALADAALPTRLDALRVGLFFGSSTGGMLESETYYAGLRATSRRRARIAALAAQPTSAPADAVAREHGVTGPVLTIASACASATLAFGSALDALRDGEIEIALVGGSDSLCRLTYAGFNSLRAVDPRACRPFRAGRDGMSIGEGAAVLVLESEGRARSRGARIHGYLRGAGAACDAHHMTSPDPEGAGIRRAVEAALADAALAPGDIDFVNVHGTGTPLNDAAEARMLAAVFGERAARLPITSAKGALGHFLGSAGAVEAVATLLALADRRVQPTAGEGAVDLAVDLVESAPRELPAARFALSTNLAFGGANAAIVLEVA